MNAATHRSGIDRRLGLYAVGVATAPVVTLGFAMLAIGVRELYLLLAEGANGWPPVTELGVEFLGLLVLGLPGLLASALALGAPWVLAVVPSLRVGARGPGEAWIVPRGVARLAAVGVALFTVLLSYALALRVLVML